MPSRKPIVAITAIIALAGNALCADTAAAALYRPAFSRTALLYRMPQPVGGGVLRPAFGGARCWQPTRNPRQREWGPCGFLLPSSNHISGY